MNREYLIRQYEHNYFGGWLERLVRRLGSVHEWLQRATIAAISATTMAMPPVNAALTAAIRELVLLARLDVSRALADVTGLREPSTARVALLFRLCCQSTHV